MTVIINGTTGITNDGGYTGDGVVFADTTPANTLVTTTDGNVLVGLASPATSDFSKTIQVQSSSSAGFVSSITGGSARTHISGTNSAGVWALYDATSQEYRLKADNSGNFQFNSGYGSVATAYGCRAWVNFNGSGTVAIQASGNVSSITDNGTGDYTMNFTTAMPDIKYAATYSFNRTGLPLIMNPFSFLTGSLRFEAMIYDTTKNDSSMVSVSIFR